MLKRWGDRLWGPRGEKGIKVCYWKKLEFLQKTSPRPHVESDAIILASIRFSLLFVRVVCFFFEASLICWLRNGWGINNLRLKFFYYLNWYTLWMIINSQKNHSTEVKRRMPSSCYLAQDSLLLAFLDLSAWGPLIAIVTDVWSEMLINLFFFCLSFFASYNFKFSFSRSSTTSGISPRFECDRNFLNLNLNSASSAPSDFSIDRTERHRISTRLHAAVMDPWSSKNPKYTLRVRTLDEIN